MITTSTSHLAKTTSSKFSILKPLKGKTTSNYSTVDVSRILGIEKSRVRNWIVEGFIIPSWHIAMARGDKNLLTYDDLCSVYIFQQLLSMGLHRAAIAFIIREIGKTGLSSLLKSGYRYVIWNSKNPKEGGNIMILGKIPDSIVGNSIQMFIIDLLNVKKEVDRKRTKRGG
jgi:hypothetical protein